MDEQDGQDMRRAKARQFGNEELVRSVWMPVGVGSLIFDMSPC